MGAKSLITPCAALLLLAGCHLPLFRSKPAASPAQIAPVTVAAGKADAATDRHDAAVAEERAKHDKLDAQNRANVAAARDANTGNPDGPPKVEVEGELGIVDQRLSAVQPDPVEVAAAAQRKALVESGKADASRIAYQDASREAQKQAAEVGRLRGEADQALRDRDAARALYRKAQDDLIAAAESNRLANQKALDELRKQMNDAVQAKQVMYLNIAGGIFGLIFAAGAGFGGFAGAKTTAPFALFALVAFGLAQIVSQWWFKYAILGAVLICLGIAIWWVWKHYKLGTLHADTVKKVSALNSVVTDVVPVLDDAYEKADAASKELLDRMIFEPLSRAMDGATKAVVHQVRADQSTPVSPHTTTAT